MSGIKTERLCLRPFEAADHAAFMAIAGDWHVARMTADLPHPLSAADAEHWLEPEPGCVRFAVTLQGRLIGGVGYYFETQPDIGKRGELGFFLARQSWGHGFAAEAAGAVIAQGFDNNNICAFTSAHFIDNAPSAKVLTRLGFTSSHRSTVWCRARGQVLDAICYRLQRSRAAALGLCREAAAPPAKPQAPEQKRKLPEATAAQAEAAEMEAPEAECCRQIFERRCS